MERKMGNGGVKVRLRGVCFWLMRGLQLRRGGSRLGIHAWRTECQIRYGWLSNHAFSFSRALNRCEMRFFSALSISAYVLPSYSKIGSQPTTSQVSNF
jgi:hypothetical protein